LVSIDDNNGKKFWAAAGQLPPDTPSKDQPFGQ